MLIRDFKLQMLLKVLINVIQAVTALTSGQQGSRKCLGVMDSSQVYTSGENDRFMSITIIFPCHKCSHFVLQG